MKKLFILLFIAICNLSYAQCPVNGDLELGNLNNWAGYTGSNTGGPTSINLLTFFPGFDPTRHVIQNAGTFDPLVGGTVLSTVDEGNFSVRLGNTLAGQGAEILSYTFIVDNANKYFSFRHASVMQDPNHPPTTTHPFFQYWFSTTSNLATSTDPGNLISTPPIAILSDLNDDLFTASELDPGIGFYPWITRCYNLSAYVGQQVTVYFLNADCSQGVHFGYTYIDALCVTNDTQPVVNLTCPTTYFCTPQDVILYGNQSFNYDSYEWIIKNLTDGNIATKTVHKPLIGGSKVGQIYLDQYGNMPDGEYEVTLRLWDCNTYVEQKCTIRVFKPEVTATSNYACCNSGISTLDLTATIQLPPGITPGTFEWYDRFSTAYLGPGTVSTNGNTVTSIFTVNTPLLMEKYQVYYVDNSNNCRSNRETVTAITLPDNAAVKIEMEHDYCNCTPSKLNAYLAPQTCNNVQVPTSEWEEWRDEIMEMDIIQWQWNTGETTESINIDPNISTYQLTGTWPCGTHTSFPKTVTPTTTLNNFSPSDYWTTSVMSVPNNQDFVIYYIPNLRPEYNATEYYLEIRDAWGSKVYEKQESITDCTSGFLDGQIRWNGYKNVAPNIGAPPPSGWWTYAYYLQLKNCSYNDIGTSNTTLQGTFQVIQ